MREKIGKSRFLVAIFMILMLAFTATACGKSDSNGDEQEDGLNIEEFDLEVEKIEKPKENQIQIGVMEKGSEELLNHAKTILEKENYDLKVIMYQDADLMNQDVLDGKLDAHLFAHQPYMNSYHFQKGDELQSHGVLCYEKYGIYGLLKDDLTNINQSTIAIPDDDLAQARALLFLKDLDYISLKEGLEERSSLKDIIDNPLEIQFVEYSVEDILKDKKKEEIEADFIVYGAYLAALQDIDVLKEALLTENMDMEGVQLLGTQLVSRKDNLESQKLKALKEAFLSKGMQDYLQYMLKGTVGTK